MVPHFTSFPEIGLPEEHQILGLGYHEMTRTVIAHTGPREAGPPVGQQLYFRWHTEATYEPVGSFPSGSSVASFVLDPVRPDLYFLTYTWKVIPGIRAGGSWDALYRFDLEEHRCERLAGPEDLTPIAGYERAWPSQLLSVSADGACVYCKSGQQAPVNEDGHKYVDYWIATLDLKRRVMTKVSKLSALSA